MRINEILQLHNKPFDLSTVNVDPEPAACSTVNSGGKFPVVVSGVVDHSLPVFVDPLAPVVKVLGSALVGDIL